MHTAAHMCTIDTSSCSWEENNKASDSRPSHSLYLSSIQKTTSICYPTTDGGTVKLLDLVIGHNQEMKSVSTSHWLANRLPKLTNQILSL